MPKSVQIIRSSVAIDNGGPPTYSLPGKEPCVREEEDSRKAEIQKMEHLQNLNMFPITAKQVLISCSFTFHNQP